ncbi:MULTISPECIES: glutathione peroxidase [Methylomicrobium]|uniref:Glutathione peroxidase n=1 Tax=Methylomicrobium album BG8 TaxID=686340 RepID=H8GGY2_METAL|nr:MULTISPECIES: glutathione peroxidase [Methylomicrobium]EIC31257.1 glutathione peroxidase [Methylomicrobium album BG8]
MTTSIYDFKVTSLNGTEASLDQYRGKVLLIVNTASRCGFTPQYQGLEELYRRYRDRGLAVLGFPCNQFGAQEPGNAEDIRSFCTVNYGVSFPMFSKIEVNGEQADPLFRYLKAQAKGILGSTAIKWNFTKFLVNRQGDVVGRYGSATKPEQLAAAIEGLLPPV